MSAISSSLYPPSNRRRCVKGRPSYIDPSDLLLSSSVNQDHNNDSFGQNDYSYVDPIESDDVEEEPITIDLSAFLNENPLLAQSAFESSAEHNIASTESSSQFRVTDCAIKPSTEIHKPSVTDEPCLVNYNVTNVGDNSISNENDNNVPNENIVTTPVFIDPLTVLHDSSKENCLSPEKLLPNVSSAPSIDITLNGKKSPIKKFSRARPLGLSNPLKKYKNFMKSKDLNKVNEKVFGKYPIVKCEKLDIENFVKNNKIKVSNWPLLHTENQKNNQHLISRNVNKKINIPKTPLKPKFMRKPINFNKLLINSNKKPLQSNASSILVDNSVSKPIVIKADSWKPGVTNLSSPVPTFFRNFITNPSVTSKTAVCDLLKLNDQTVIYNTFSSPEKETEKRTKPVFMNVNKSLNRPKNYQFIAPKPSRPPDIVNLVPSLPKPVIQPVSDEFTVIEQYVDDPSSPQKPKPILTVPVEVLASPEKQNSMLHSNTSIAAEESEKSESVVKSVFLNGAIRQVSTIKKEGSLKESIIPKRKFDQENISSKETVSVAIVEKEQAEDSVLKAKNAIVDAMQSAFSSVLKKKKPKVMKKEHFNMISNPLVTEPTSYSSILNDNILHGFSENDFEDLPFDTEDEINTSIPCSILTPHRESSVGKVKSKNKRKKISKGIPTNSSDTLSASEGENECNEDVNVDKITSPKTPKRRRTISRDISEDRIPLSLPEDSEKLDTSLNSSNNTVHSEVFNNAESNKVFDSKHVDSSLSFSRLENHISDSVDVTNDAPLSPETDKQTEISNTSLSETINNNTENNPQQNKKVKMCDNSPKQETCTRTLRERKCSSTEVEKLSDSSVKQGLHSKNSPEKTKVKGSINSKLKIQMKTPPRSTAKVKIKRKSYKPEDIIREINTITGGRRVSERTPKKHEKSDSEKNNKGSDFSDISNKHDSESNSSVSHKWSRQSHPFSKKKRTLKVRIKRSKKKNSASCLKMQLNSFTDVLENANSTSSVPENNVNLHSSFREGKVCNMGTPLKEENTAENSTSVSDSNMEVKEDEKSVRADHMSANEDPMVTSSETSLLQDASIVNSDLNNTVSESSILDESQNDESRLSSDAVVREDTNELEEQSVLKSEGEKSNISSGDVSDNSDYSKCCDSILNKNSGMSVESFLFSVDKNSKGTTAPLVESIEEKSESICVEETPNDSLTSVQDADVTVPPSEEIAKDSSKEINNENDISEAEVDAFKNDSDMEPNDSLTSVQDADVTVSPSEEIAKDSSKEINNENDISEAEVDASKNDSDMEPNDSLTSVQDADVTVSPSEEIAKDSSKKINNENDISEAEVDASKKESDMEPEEDEILRSEEPVTEFNPEEAEKNKNKASDHHHDNELAQLPSAETAEKFESELQVAMTEEEEASSDANVVCGELKPEMTDRVSDNTNVPTIETPEESTLDCVEKEIICGEEMDNDSNLVSENLQPDVCKSVNVVEDSHLQISEITISEQNVLSAETDVCKSVNVEQDLHLQSSEITISEQSVFSTETDVCKSINVEQDSYLQSSEITISEQNVLSAETDVCKSANVEQDSHLQSSEIISEQNVLSAETDVCKTVNVEQDSHLQSSEIISEQNVLSAETDVCKTVNVEQDSHLQSSEITVSEQNALSTETDSANECEKSSKKQESKKCPKIKISFIQNSPDSLKNWFVSESKKDDTSEVLPTSSEPDDNSLISLKSLTESTINSNTSLDVEHNKSALEDKELPAVTETSSEVVSSEKTGNTHTEVDMAENESESRDMLTSKPAISSAEENQSTHISETPTNDLLTAENNSTMIETVLESSIEISKCDAPAAVEGFDPFIKIKEEPMDVEEENPDVNLKSQAKITPVNAAEIPKKRGRPRKSSVVGRSSTKSAEKEIKAKSPEINITSPVKVEEQVDDKTALTEIVAAMQKTPVPATTPQSGQKKKNSSRSRSTPVSGGRKKNYDPELVCVPFSLGWMREHVIRATGTAGNKQQSDIYYFAPDGKKLRSMPEISSYLSKHTDIKLTLAHFTFAKERIYREPFEIERGAKVALKGLVTPKKEPSAKTPSPNKKRVSSEHKTKKSYVTPSSLQGDKQDQSSTKNAVFSPDSEVSKHRRSSSRETDVSKTHKRNYSLNDLDYSKGSKQKTIDIYLNNENKTSERKLLRPSRKIVKKVPFDNSFENMFPKTPRLTDKKSYSKIGIKIETDNSTSSVNELNNDIQSITKQNGLPNKQTLNSSSPALANSSRLAVNKSSASNSASVINESSLERTNINTPSIKNKLRVKIATPTTKKSGAALHDPCNKYCNFAQVRQPAIQCSICLCLFHPECIPFKPTGLTKYACVPCVKRQMINSQEEDNSENCFPDFDIELLYPHIDLQITSDPKFDKYFNKFYSPVDPSFVHSRVNDTVTTPGSKVYPQIFPRGVPTYTIINNSNFSLLNQYTTRPRSDYCTSFNAANMCNKGYSVMIANSAPLQRTPSNISYGNTASSGSLPLLQNFSNSYFQQNQPCNRTGLNQPVNFQNSFYQRPTYNNPCGNSASSVQPNRIIVQKGAKSTEVIPKKVYIVARSDKTLQSGSGISPSLLKTILQQADSALRGNSQINNPPANIAQSTTSSVEKSINLPKMGDSTFESSNISHDSTLPVATVSKKDSLPQVPSSSQSDSNINKRTDVFQDTNDRKRMKTFHSDQSVLAGSSAGVSEHFHKPNESDLFSSVWNINKFSQVYECLNLIFKYLNVSDLLSASLVCRSWNHLASQKLLWEYACFSGVFIKNWYKFSRILNKHGTKFIDFRGIRNQDSLSEWEAFIKHLHYLSEVEELTFEKVPPFVINAIADTLPQLKRLICYCMTSVFTEPEIWSTPCKFQLSKLRCLGQLEALKISSMGGIVLDNTQKSLMPYLPKLTQLVLTGFKFNSCMNLECLSQQKQLISLELGDCTDIEPQIYGLLVKLVNLENLCLQNGGNIDDTKLPEALSKMSKLKNLELMNFQVSSHLPEVLKKMDSLLHFSLWPDNSSMAAQVNFNSFSSATSCNNLKSLIWGILTEDDDTVPSALELHDSVKNETKTLSFQELFQSLVKRYPGMKVELKCLPRTIWSEYCSTRNFM